MKHPFFEGMKSQQGLAFDEIVLVMTMLASFGAFVVVSVSWDAVTGAQPAYVRMQNQFQEIEKANQEFYQRHRMWPNQATDGQWGNNAAALVTRDAMRHPYKTMTSFSNLLPDYRIDRKSRQLQHKFGAGGAIMQRAVSFGEEEYIEVIFENVPYEDARRVDEEVDGQYDPNNGRMYLIFKDEQVDIHYRANQTS